MATATLKFADSTYTIDLGAGIDISIPVSREAGPNAFYLPEPAFSTVEAGGFVGDVRRGGSCNVEDISFSPHGNGTHTECAGHIAPEDIYIRDILPEVLLPAKLISVQPEDGVISADMIRRKLDSNPEPVTALIVRTLPNDEDKRIKNYSGQDPTYFHTGAIHEINRESIMHLLTDLPSLDKEDDNRLQAHHAFFREGESWNRKKTVTEMVFVPDEIPDGLYALNLQIAAFESDAGPSRPVLYFLQAE